MKKTLAIAVAMLMSTSAYASTTVYNSKAAFDAALGASTVEDFSDTTLEPGLSFSSSVGAIGGGLFNDRVVRSGATTTFSFSSAVTGFGGIFDETPGGFGQGLAFYLDGTTFVGQLDGATSTFYGFISTVPFTSVLITAGVSSGVAETYNLDNLQFDAAHPVPEPATWAMMIIGLGAAGGTMRYRRRSTKIAYAA